MSALNALCEPLDAVLARAPGSWQRWVQPWRESAEGRDLVSFVDARRAAGAVVYPGMVLRALELTPFDAVRVVILGQDPYHGAGQAEGLAFSVPPGQRIPPSLRNIHAEVLRDLGVTPPAHGHLGGWARQGVLLLNTTLTVEAASPGSHAKRGWEALTGALLEALADDPQPKTFLLWGAHAQLRYPDSPTAVHAVFASNHPSPLAARRGAVPFIGNGHFSAANRHLSASGRGSIDWGNLPA
ncbi:MAG: uracil-DNA glycosylase [Rubrivivax sp.]